MLKILQSKAISIFIIVGLFLSLIGVYSDNQKKESTIVSLESTLSAPQSSYSVMGVMGNTPPTEYFSDPNPQNTVTGVGRMSGTNIILDVDGTPERWILYDLDGAVYTKILVLCDYCIVQNGKVQRSWSHGVQIGDNYKFPPKFVIVQNIEITDSVIQNKPPYSGGSWGSCIKTWINVTYVKIRNNKVENCYGEGIGVTESFWIQVENNIVKNALQVSIYPDNATHVVVRGNTIYCVDREFYRKDGKPSYGITTADEKYSGFYGGSSISLLGDIWVIGNTSYSCQPVIYWGGFHSPKGLAGGRWLNNTFYDTTSPLAYVSGERNSDIVVSGNSILSSGGVTPTNTVSLPTATRTPTPTITATSPVSSSTPTRTITPTRTPTSIPTCYPVSVGGKFIGNFCP